MQRTRSHRYFRSAALATLTGVGILLVGPATPASALSGYAIGGHQASISRPLGTSNTDSAGQTFSSTSEPVVIHAPSMASSEGCPAEQQEGVEVTMIHADGTEYDCQTGDYTIR